MRSVKERQNKPLQKNLSQFKLWEGIELCQDIEKTMASKFLAKKNALFSSREIKIKRIL